MKYFVIVNKEYRYIKIFNVLKKIHESGNPASKAFASFVEKLIPKKSKAGEQ